LSQICHGAGENVRDRAGAVETATRRKPYAISLFGTARDRPGPLAASSIPAGRRASLLAGPSGVSKSDFTVCSQNKARVVFLRAGNCGSAHLRNLARLIEMNGVHFKTAIFRELAKPPDESFFLVRLPQERAPA
jgi:hypothetical protein